jgi:hypothetical protein
MHILRPGGQGCLVMHVCGITRADGGHGRTHAGLDQGPAEPDLMLPTCIGRNRVGPSHDLCINVVTGNAVTGS